LESGFGWGMNLVWLEQLVGITGTVMDGMYKRLGNMAF
jgi:hypothetical protein